jgi:hypothetical protein
LPDRARVGAKEVVMKRLITIIALAVPAVAAAGCGGTTKVTKTVTITPAATSNEIAQFGYVKSLEHKGSGYEMRFDPALMLSGETANVAAAEDGAVPAGEPVPNDNYVVDEGHRLLTYEVPADAHVTALTKGVGGSPITVAQLAQLVRGENPFPKPLFEPITTGFWIRVQIDTVRALDQQYRP